MGVVVGVFDKGYWMGVIKSLICNISLKNGSTNYYIERGNLDVRKDLNEVLNRTLD